MAKLALKLRDQKRRKTVEKFKARRAQLLEIIYDQRASDEAREEARDKLQVPDPGQDGRIEELDAGEGVTRHSGAPRWEQGTGNGELGTEPP